ncbi:MAG TPA: ribonuclease E/G, partial [Lacunisphaera sp.]|nr:ribonuclease E/G [Lacunisphaera sp.]
MNDQPTNSGSPADAASRHEEELQQPPPQKHTEPLTAEQLRKDSKERAADRPILQKILSIFRKEKGTFRELVINSEPLEKRVALLVDGTLDRFEIERESDSRMVGGIYKGRVKNLDPGLKAAFVDIGYNKNAFLHYWD